MYSRRWATSPRQYETLVERDVKVRMADGTSLDGDLYRPDAPGERFPVILGAHPYNKLLQSPPTELAHVGRLATLARCCTAR